MKIVFLYITLILAASVFTQTSPSRKSQIAAEFFNGFFQYQKGEDWRFNEKCFVDKLNSQYEELANVVTAHWLDIGDVFRMMAQVERSITAECDFPELKEFNQIYTEQVKSGDYMKNIAFRALHIAQIIRDLYDSAYRTNPQHIGVSCSKISNYLVYVENKSLKFFN